MPGEMAALFIGLGLKTDELNKGISNAQGQLNSFFGWLKSMIAPMAGALALGSLFGKWSSQADELGKFADRLGVGIQEMDAWSRAAQLSGASAGEFMGTLDGLNKSIQEIAEIGTGRAKKSFDELGIKIKDSAGKTKSSIDILNELAGKVGGMDTAKFAGLAKKAGIDAGTITLLQTGKKSVQELVNEMKQFALTKDDQEAAEKFNNSVQVLGKSLLSVAAVFFRNVTPAITWFADKLTKLFAYLKQHGAAVIAFFEALAAVIAYKFTPAVIAMGKAWLKNPLTWIIAGLALLAIVIEDLWVYINGGKSAFGGFWSMFGKGDGAISGLIQGFLQFVLYSTVAIGMMMKMKGALGDVGTAFNILNKVFAKTVIGAVIAIIVLLIMLLIKNWDSVVAGFDTGIKKIKEWFEGIKQTINDFKESVSGVMDKVQNFFGFGDKKKTDATASALGPIPGANITSSASVPGQVLTQGGARNINTDTTINGGINIVVPGGDPDKIARGISGATQDAFRRDAALNAASPAW